MRQTKETTPNQTNREWLPTDYRSVAARIQNPTSQRQLAIDRARLEYYDRFDPVFGIWGDRELPY